MKIKKDQKRKWGKRIFSWNAIFILALSVIIMCPAKILADGANDGKMALMGGFDSNGENVFSSACFAVITGETEAFVFSSLYNGSADEVIVIFQNEKFELNPENRKDSADGNYTMWEMDNLEQEFMLNEGAFYQASYPVQNETVTIYYYASGNGGIEVKSATTTLLELKNETVLEVDGLPGDIVNYPAVLVNQQGNYVGMVTKAGTAITLSGDEEEFYGGSSGGSGGNGGGSDGGSGDGSGSGGGSDGGGSGGSGDGSGNDGGSDGSGSSDNGGELTKRRDGDIQNKDTDSNEYMQYIMIAAAGVVIVLVGIIVFLARKKKPDAQAGQNFNGGAAGPVQGYGGPTAPAQGYGEPATPARGYAGATRPLQDYENVDFEQRARMPEAKPACCLVGTGGYMDGRKYPFAGKEITIGRYNTNVIRYSENAPGVSRSHAKLYMDGGRLMLMDCNSSSGTFLKRTGKLQPMLPVEVKIGDVFYIGEKRNGFIIQK